MKQVAYYKGCLASLSAKELDTSTQAKLDALIAAGVDIFRLNFSHGTHEEHAAVIRAIREGEARDLIYARSAMVIAAA